MKPSEIPERIAIVRDQLLRADRTADQAVAIGAILIALDGIVELIEATNKRVDGAYEYAGNVL